MKNNWFSKKSKFYPITILVFLTVVQFVFVQWSMQSYWNSAEQNGETLYQRMREDNIPSDIKEHLLYVQNQSTSNNSRLISSLATMQIFFQFSMLVIFYKFYLAKNRTFEEDKQSEL